MQISAIWLCIKWDNTYIAPKSACLVCRTYLVSADSLAFLTSLSPAVCRQELCSVRGCFQDPVQSWNELERQQEFSHESKLDWLVSSMFLPRRPCSFHFRSYNLVTLTEALVSRQLSDMVEAGVLFSSLPLSGGAHSGFVGKIIVNSLPSYSQGQTSWWLRYELGSQKEPHLTSSPVIF